MIPDGEKVLSKYLRAHPALAELETRIVGKTPEDTTRSWVRLTQLDAGPVDRRAGSLVEFYFQLDCYAGEQGGQPEAALLATAVFAAIAELEGANYRSDGAVITAAGPNLGARAPDTDFEPARERFVSTAVVHMHAAPEEGS